MNDTYLINKLEQQEKELGTKQVFITLKGINHQEDIINSDTLKYLFKLTIDKCVDAYFITRDEDGEIYYRLSPKSITGNEKEIKVLENNDNGNYFYAFLSSNRDYGILPYEDGIRIFELPIQNDVNQDNDTDFKTRLTDEKVKNIFSIINKGGVFSNQANIIVIRNNKVDLNKDIFYNYLYFKDLLTDVNIIFYQEKDGKIIKHIFSVPTIFKGTENEQKCYGNGNTLSIREITEDQYKEEKKDNILKVNEKTGKIVIDL